MTVDRLDEPGGTVPDRRRSRSALVPTTVNTAALGLAVAAVAGLVAAAAGELAARSREHQIDAMLAAQGWSVTPPGVVATLLSGPAVRFGVVAGAITLVTWVLAVSSHGPRRRLLAGVLATAVLGGWTVTGWLSAGDGASPWPGVTPPAQAWGPGLAPAGFDVALVGPAVVLLAIWSTVGWAAVRVRHRPTLPVGEPRTGPPRTGTDIAAVVLGIVSGAWAVGAVAAFLVLSKIEAGTGWSPSVPSWLLLVAVPVAVAASGRGAANLALLLAATVALGTEHLEQAAYALDVRPLVLVALAVAGTLGAYSRRPAVRGLHAALS